MVDREALIAALADKIQAQGRRAGSGEPLFFDRFNLERVIREVLIGAQDAGGKVSTSGVLRAINLKGVPPFEDPS